MIVLFTDFGLTGPYTGQVKAVLAEAAGSVPVIDLFADAPTSDPKRAAYLLAAYDDVFSEGTVFLCVVDPGVGGRRPPVMLLADGNWYVGPGNGLFELVARRAEHATLYEIDWKPPGLSASFHGRDLFAPTAAALALGEDAPRTERPLRGAWPDGSVLPGHDWPDDLAEVVYVDHYGNLLTGLRIGAVKPTARLRLGGQTMTQARTYSDVPEGAAFWYENANGLVEIAVREGRAERVLKAGIGAKLEIV